MLKWLISASMAGFEYLPLTLAFTIANKHAVSLALMTAYMEAVDNFFRMMQQLTLHDPLGWFDWVAAAGLALCVVWQGLLHARQGNHPDAKSPPMSAGVSTSVVPQPLAQSSLDVSAEDKAQGLEEDANDNDNDTLISDREVEGNLNDNSTELQVLHHDAEDENGRMRLLGDLHADNNGVGVEGNEAQVLVDDPTTAISVTHEHKVYCLGLDKERFIIVLVSAFFIVIGIPTVTLEGGPTGQAYVLATVSTGAKTFAWWINQYPQMQHLNLWQKWLAGWSIAALIEYFPLIGAFSIAGSNGVHLGLMTAYMEALDNFFRILQQRMLNKALFWYDYTAAVGMFAFVIFQGVMRYEFDHGNL